MRNLSIKISHYKCFGDTEQGFDQILPINVVIGRNNVGKSALLELIDKVTNEDARFARHLWHKGNEPKLILSHPLSEDEVRRMFPENSSGGVIPGNNHWEFGRKWIGRPIHWQIDSSGQHKCIKVDPPFNVGGQQLADNVARAKTNPLLNKIFKRLLADRDINPEPDSREKRLKGNGDGATNIIQNYLNKAELPSELVQGTLLNELNLIFEPDAKFDDIVCQQLDDNRWEIYLKEAHKGIIPLSHSGSGLKTVLLVLLYLHFLPKLEKKELGQFIFAFEELENNLHPALLRRFLKYLEKQALKNDCTIFLTSHSNVLIDLFSHNADAQIIHVTHSGENAVCKTVKTYIDNRGILDDLDVRASDLLQSNAVVWVEGPSDRLYFNKWVDLWSDGQLQEGAHYQCVFYGGRLLAHLSAEFEEESKWVQILRVNRNAILIGDSDRKSKDHDINATKKRIMTEIEDIGGYGWITEGREIENYIPLSILEKLHSPGLPKLEKFTSFADYLNDINAGEGEKFLRSKAIYAEKVCQALTKESLSEVMDLATRLDSVCNLLKKWNGIRTN